VTGHEDHAGHEDRNPELALQKVIAGNNIYLNSSDSQVGVSRERARETAQNGQRPYAVVVSCSDSRVPSEYIFAAGIGDLFIVRTAGNVIGEFELGSIEFAVQYLKAPLIVVMGHCNCGAVAAALANQGDGYLSAVVREIQSGLDGVTDEEEAIRKNVLHSKQRILESAVVQELLESGQLMIACAEYDLFTKHVDFLA